MCVCVALSLYAGIELSISGAKIIFLFKDLLSFLFKIFRYRVTKKKSDTLLKSHGFYKWKTVIFFLNGLKCLAPDISYVSMCCVCVCVCVCESCFI